jgi:hypothetical protein
MIAELRQPPDFSRRVGPAAALALQRMLTAQDPMLCLQELKD